MSTVKTVKKVSTTKLKTVAKKSAKTLSTVKKTTKLSGEIRTKVSVKLKPKKTIAEKKSIQVGSLVIVTQPSTYSESDYLIFLRQNKYPGTVLSIDLQNNSVNVGFERNAVAQDVMARYDISDLKEVDIKDKDELVKNFNESSKAYLSNKLNASLAKLNSEQHIPFYERKDFERTRKFLNTNLNYVSLVPKSSNPSLEEALSTNISRSNNNGAACCSFTKSELSMYVFIPKLWLNYFGYDLQDLKVWLDFCSNCETGFSAKYVGSTPFSKTPLPIATFIPSPNTLSDKSPQTFTYQDMEAYVVYLEGSPSGMNTYMNFILLRYIYNYQYYTIPFIAMTIKSKLKSDITFWEALLCAHLNESYYAYYSFLSQGSDGKQVPLNPFSQSNSPKNVISKLKSSSMNNSFTYDNSLEGRKISNTIKECIRNSNFEELLELVKKLKK